MSKALLQQMQLMREVQAIQSDTVRLTLALGHNEKTYALRMALPDEAAAANFELKQGKAPASFMERDLQRWLEALR